MHFQGKQGFLLDSFKPLFSGTPSEKMLWRPLKMSEALVDTSIPPCRLRVYYCHKGWWVGAPLYTSLARPLILGEGAHWGNEGSTKQHYATLSSTKQH